MIKKIFTIDAETDPFDGTIDIKPFVWGLYTEGFYKEIWSESINDLIDYLKEQGECIVYAHNGGKFDFHFFMDLIKGGQEITIIAGRIAKFKIGNIEFRDSYCILPVKLATFNKDEFDYDKLHRSVRHLHTKEISEYLKNDCRYLYNAVMDFRNHYGDALTIAGASIKVFSKMSKIKRPQTSAAFFDEFTEYYYGGRVECFKSGVFEKELTVIDINSAYPDAMSKYEHPYGNKFSLDDKLPKSEAYLRRSFIEIECESFGCFPVRTKTGLSFPCDGLIRLFKVSGHELFTALELGLIKKYKIKSVKTFSDSINFKVYVDYFTELKISAKESGDKNLYIFAKLFLNALYGKYASNFHKYSHYEVVHLGNVNQKLMSDYNFCAILSDTTCLMSCDLSEDEKRFLNVATAASITGAVRANLMQAMHRCSQVYYCDTDSIVCESSGDLELHPTRLGAWDIEAKITAAAFAGKKLYALKLRDDYIKDGVTHKIASKGARLTPEEIFRVAAGEEIQYTSNVPTFSLGGVKLISRKIRKTIDI